MSDGHTRSLDLLLAALALCAVIFAAYGLLAGGEPAHNRSRTVTCSSDNSMTNSKTANNSRSKTGDSSHDDRSSGATTSDAASSDGPAKTNGGTTPDVTDSSMPQPDPDGRTTGVIRGQVLFENGDPARGAVVIGVVLPDGHEPTRAHGEDYPAYRARLVRYIAETPQREHRAVCDAEGRFVLNNLGQSGNYYLRAFLDTHWCQADDVAIGDSVLMKLVYGVLVEGRVERRDGKPVTEFTIHVADQPLDSSSYAGILQYGFHSVDGRFRLVVRGGRSLLYFTAEGLHLANYIEIDPRQPPPALRIILDASSTLELVSSSPGQQPLPDTDVWIEFLGPSLELPPGWGVRSPFIQTASSRTDSRGRLRLTLPPGSYRVNMRSGNQSSLKEITLAEGETMTLSVELDVNRVLINATDSAGKPVRIERADFAAMPNETWTHVTALPPGQPGTIEYAGLAPGEYRVTVHGEGGLSGKRNITVSDKTTRLDILLTPGATIVGRILEQTETWTALTALLTRDGGVNEAPAARNWFWSRSDFRVGPVEPGRWVFKILHGSRELYSEILTLNEGTVRRDLTLTSEAWLEIRALNESGQPVQWAEISLVGADGEVYSSFAPGDGRTTIPFLIPGEYTLTATRHNMLSRRARLTISRGANQVEILLGPPDCTRVNALPSETETRAVLEIGDLILELNGQTVHGTQGFRKLWRELKEGETASLAVLRNNARVNLSLRGGAFGYGLEDARR